MLLNVIFNINEILKNRGNNQFGHFDDNFNHDFLRGSSNVENVKFNNYLIEFRFVLVAICVSFI